MALDTYAGLKAAIASRLNRTDLTASIPDFIALAEARIFRDMEGRQALARKTLTLSAETLSVPYDFRRALSLTMTEPRQELDYIASPNLGSYATTGTGQPRYYTIEDTRIRLLPEPDQSYEAVLLYEARLDRLAAASDTNWVLDQHPDVYLYGALIEAGDHLRDDERIPRWEARFAASVASMNADNDAPAARSRLRASEAMVMAGGRSGYDITRDI